MNTLMGDNQAPGSCAKFTAAIFLGGGIPAAPCIRAADSRLPETAGVVGVSAAAFLLPSPPLPPLSQERSLILHKWNRRHMTGGITPP